MQNIKTSITFAQLVLICKRIIMILYFYLTLKSGILFIRMGGGKSIHSERAYILDDSPFLETIVITFWSHGPHYGENAKFQSCILNQIKKDWNEANCYITCWVDLTEGPDNAFVSFPY